MLSQTNSMATKIKLNPGESWWEQYTELAPTFKTVMTRSKYRMLQEKLGCPIGALLLTLPPRSRREKARAGGKTGPQPRSGSGPRRTLKHGVAKRWPTRRRRRRQRRCEHCASATTGLASTTSHFVVSLDLAPEPEHAVAAARLTSELPEQMESAPCDGSHQDNLGTLDSEEQQQNGGSSASCVNLSAETAPPMNVEMQESNAEGSGSACRNQFEEKPMVSNTMRLDTVRSDFNVQRDAQTSAVETRDVRPIILYPNKDSGYADVLYADSSSTNSITETRETSTSDGESGYLDAIILGSLVPDSRAESVNAEGVHACSPRTNLVHEMRKSGVVSECTISSPFLLPNKESTESSVPNVTSYSSDVKRGNAKSNSVRATIPDSGTESANIHAEDVTTSVTNLNALMRVTQMSDMCSECLELSSDGQMLVDFADESTCTESVSTSTTDLPRDAKSRRISKYRSERTDSFTVGQTKLGLSNESTNIAAMHPGTSDINCVDQATNRHTLSVNRYMESFSERPMISDHGTESANIHTADVDTSIRNFVDQDRVMQKSGIQSGHVNSSTLGSTFGDLTAESANTDSVYNRTPRTDLISDIKDTRTSNAEKRYVNPFNFERIGLDTKTESTDVNVHPDTSGNNFMDQKKEMQASNQGVGYVNSFASPITIDPESTSQNVNPAYACPSNAEHQSYARYQGPGCDNQIDSLNMTSEGQIVDVETVYEETNNLEWSNAETRGSVGSVASEEMDIDVEGMDTDSPIVPDEWCDACRQRFAPSSDIAKLSKRYRVAKWIGSLLEFIGLMSFDDSDDMSMDMLDPHSMAAASHTSDSSSGHSRGFFF